MTKPRLVSIIALANTKAGVAIVFAIIGLLGLPLGYTRAAVELYAEMVGSTKECPPCPPLDVAEPLPDPVPVEGADHEGDIPADEARLLDEVPDAVLP